MPRTRPPYPPEFRAEAIRLAKNSGDSIGQVAKDLGVSDQTLRNWVNQADGASFEWISATAYRLTASWLLAA